MFETRVPAVELLTRALTWVQQNPAVDVLDFHGDTDDDFVSMMLADSYASWNVAAQWDLEDGPMRRFTAVVDGLQFIIYAENAPEAA